MSEQTGPAHKDLGDRGTGGPAAAPRPRGGCRRVRRDPEVPRPGPGGREGAETHLRGRLLSEARLLEKDADVRAGPRSPSPETEVKGQ